MITEDYVSFETAKLLKKKGFDELCRCVYSPEGVFHKSNRTNIFDDYDNALLDEVGNADYFLAPTQAQAMKWLREVHHLTIDIFHFRDWKVNIKTTDDYLKADYDNPELKPSETYEEACEAAIKYCLENLI